MKDTQINLNRVAVSVFKLKVRDAANNEDSDKEVKNEHSENNEID